MPLTDAGLGELRDQYARALELTAPAGALLAQLDRADALRERYAARRFVRVDDVLPARPLTVMATTLASMLLPVVDVVSTRHRVEADGSLSYGSRFGRVDPACVSNPTSRAKLERLLDTVGLTAFGAELGSRLTPLIRYVVGDVAYRRVYFYLYQEGDYIAAHDDSHVGNRIDVQFPVTVDGVGGIRVLSDGLFQMHYDVAGSMNILGPSMWHDVPPLVRVAGAPPRRVNVGLRFTPD